MLGEQEQRERDREQRAERSASTMNAGHAARRDARERVGERCARSVTAGLAKLVDDVNQYAAAM